MTDAIAVLKQILDSSVQLSTWALAVFGGSVAAIVGTSYRRPYLIRWRLPFFLFVPGWACLAWSLHLGNTIAGRYLASTVGKQSNLAQIGMRINDDFASQRAFLFYSLLIFGVWLVIYLCYWIFGPDKEGS